MCPGSDPATNNIAKDARASRVVEHSIAIAEYQQDFAASRASLPLIGARASRLHFPHHLIEVKTRRLLAWRILLEALDPLRGDNARRLHRADGWNVWLTFAISPAAQSKTSAKK